MSTPPGPPMYRNLDCNVWAQNKIKAIKKKNKDASPQKVYIKPIGTKMKNIGAVKMASTDEYVIPDPHWGDHYSVRYNDLYMDEQFPNGLDKDTYMARFESADALSFTDVADDHKS